MGQTQTFDSSNIFSIIDFDNRILEEYDDSTIDDKLIKVNITKAIDAIKLIKESESYNDINKKEELLRLIVNLSQYCRLEKIIKEIIKRDLYSILLEIIEQEMKKENLKYYVLDYVFVSLQNLTTHSVLIAKENVKYNFHESALDFLDRIDILTATKLKDVTTISFYSNLIGFLDEMSCYSEVRDALIDIQTVKRLSAHMKVVDEMSKTRVEVKAIKTDIFSTIAKLLNDQELGKLCMSNEIVSTFIQIFEDIMSQARINTKVLDNTKYYFSFNIGVTIVNIIAKKHLNQIIAIAANDTIKQSLFENGIMRLLEELLVNGNEDEVEKSSQLLCLLCFNENVLKYVKENESVLEIIKMIKHKTKNENTKKSCLQIEIMVEDVIQYHQMRTGEHIMISYNHKYQEQCLKINEQLKKNNFKTWMDVSTTFNDLHEAMAGAIENASVVLICYSYEYKLSNNCRLEAQYAVKLNKPIVAVKMQPGYEPDGWLGMILASKLYVDFSVRSINVYELLIKQIKISLSEINTSDTHQQLDVKGPTKWNCEEVQNWLKENSLDTLVNVFADCTGMSLKGLWEMKQINYDKFCSTIDQEIEKSKEDVNTFQKMSFYSLLQDLFHY